MTGVQTCALPICARPIGDSRNLGHIHSVVWIKFTLHAMAGDTTPRVLELAYPFADNVDLFTPQPAGGFRISRGGDHTRLSEREIPDRLFLFPATPAPGADTTYDNLVDRSALADR